MSQDQCFGSILAIMMGNQPSTLKPVQWNPWVQFVPQIISNHIWNDQVINFKLINFSTTRLIQQLKLTTWPKVLDVIFISLFGVLTILAWADQKRDEVYKYWSGAIINGGLLLGIIISWLCGRDGNPALFGFVVSTFCALSIYIQPRFIISRKSCRALRLFPTWIYSQLPCK